MTVAPEAAYWAVVDPPEEEVDPPEEEKDVPRRASQQTADPTGYAGYGTGRVEGWSRTRSPQPAPGRRGGGRFIDYPRNGRTGWTRWVPSWRLVTALLALGILLMVFMFFVAYANTSVPTEDSLAKAQTTVFYYADGRTEIGKVGVQNRQKVPYADVPPTTRDAVLSAEDRTFFTNSGVSLTSIVRAALSNAQGNSLQGGSTITQQYVKNVFDLRDRSIQRKAREFFIALKISRSTPKQQILETYLNTIYFGRGCYGIQTAAQCYFHTSVQKLTVSQSAFLAGIINGPELYDPTDGATSAARAKERWNYVLDGMVAMGSLSSADRAKMVFPTVAKPVTKNSLAGANGYLLKTAEAEAAQDMKITQQELETGGYKITTTFDPRLVNEARAAVRAELPTARKRPKGLQIGMATIDPNSGAVLSIYGGADYLVRNRNAATQDMAEAGSTMKAFGLIAALEDGVSLRSRFDSSSPMKVQGKKFENFGGEQFGTIDLVKATAQSVNTVFVQLNAKVGPEKTADAARRAGLRDTVGIQNNLANVLGSASPTPLQLANAYATIAAGGVYRPAYTVRTIRSVETGKEIPWDRSRLQGSRVFDQDAIADATYAMQQVVNHGSGAYAQRLNRPAAGKTGTSTDSRSAWFAGFTPQLVTTVAMYQLGNVNGVEVNIPMKPFGGVRSIVGGGFPTRIWTDFMKNALNGKPKLDFPQPVYGGDAVNPAPVHTWQPTTQSSAPPSTPTQLPTQAPTTAAAPPPSSPTATQTHKRPTRTPRPTPTTPFPTTGTTT